MGDARLLAEGGDEALVGDQVLEVEAVFAIGIGEKLGISSKLASEPFGRLGDIGGVDRPVAARHMGVAGAVMTDGDAGIGEFANLIPTHDAMDTGVDRIRRNEQSEGKPRRFEPGPSLLIDRAIGVVDGNPDGLVGKRRAGAQRGDDIGQGQYAVAAGDEFLDLRLELIDPDVGRRQGILAEAVIHDDHGGSGGLDRRRG